MIKHGMASRDTIESDAFSLFKSATDKIHVNATKQHGE